MTIVVSLVWEHDKKKRRDQHRDHTEASRKGIVSLLFKAHCLTLHRKYSLVFQGGKLHLQSFTLLTVVLTNSMVINPIHKEKQWYLCGHLNLNNQYVEST